MGNGKRPQTGVTTLFAALIPDFRCSVIQRDARRD